MKIRRIQNKYYKLAATGATLALVVSFTLVSVQIRGRISASVLRAGAVADPQTQAAIAVQRQERENLALRLDQRLHDAKATTPGPKALGDALKERDALLGTTLRIVISALGKEQSTTVAVKDHPEWIVLHTDRWSASYAPDTTAIAKSLNDNAIAGLTLYRPSTVLAVTADKKNVLRAAVSAHAVGGYEMLSANTAQIIADAIAQGTPSVTLAAVYHEPTITMMGDDGAMEELTILGTGYSDFTNSTPGRLSNLHKAFEERIRNVVIKHGETFSLVASLDAPITLAKGWKEDLGLFGGGAAMTPGAGICQSATTLFRAALLAGLPIVEKRNHSLFVDHYEPLGIGLDATVFPGQQDLKIRNDTAGDMIIQSSIEGNTAIVQLFGRKDARSVTMQGPFFQNSTTRPKALRAIGRNEIGWVRVLTAADGTVTQEPIISSYNKPYYRSLMTKYGAAEGMKLLVPETDGAS